MRRENDFYPTPEWATNDLLNRGIPIGGWILECCAGDLAIANPLKRAGQVLTNDIDPNMPVMFHRDCVMENWDYGAKIDWVVTNPPFNLAAEIVPLAYQAASEGMAMLLRLSYLEPVKNRGEWLNKHPPTTLIVLPRISFTGNGKTDSVTCAWMIWDKHTTSQQIIIAKNGKFIST